jgi:enoyl-CoA hydratase
MAYKAFEVEIRDHIAEVKLNRAAALNTLNAAFWAECRDIFDGLNDNPQVRVVVILSTGKHFSAGIDLGFLASLAPDPKADPARTHEKIRRQILDLQASFTAIANCRLPVLAGIQGGCIGAGVDLVAACDMRYATSDAYFCIQEINIGMAADVGTLQRMPLQIPQGLMRELAFTGRKLGAAEAKETGFVNAVSDSPEALRQHVLGIAAEIAQKSPLAITGTKQALNQSNRRQIEEGLDYIATWNAGQLSFADLERGARAALAKTKANFGDLLD